MPVAARATPGANGGGEHTAQKRPRAGGLLHRRAHLPKDFGLAEHHRLKTAADAEQMASRRIAGQSNRSGLQQPVGERQRRGHHRRDRLIVGIAGRTPIDFEAIAGRQHDRADPGRRQTGMQARGITMRDHATESGQTARAMAQRDHAKRIQGARRSDFVSKCGQCCTCSVPTSRAPRNSYQSGRALRTST
jgi:hypothetical protein